MAKVGIDMFHFFPLTVDTKEAITYGTGVHVPGLIQVDVKPNASSGILYADNGAYESDTAEGETEMTFEMADLPQDVVQALLGHAQDAKGVQTAYSTDTAGYVGIAFRVLMADGKYGFIKYTKCKAQAPDETYKTKGDKVEFGTPKFIMKCVCRKHDGLKWRKTREDATGYVDVSTSWFANFEPTT